MSTSPEKVARPTTPAEEESLDELPPMDGGDGDDEDAPAEDLDDDGEEGAVDAFDDSTGEGDPLEEIALEAALGGPAVADRGLVNESGWLDDSAEAEELDIGAHDLEAGEKDDLLSDVDAPGVGEEDFGLADDSSKADVDGGEEGPDAEDEELRVEDLPQLDADDDGDLDDATLVDRWLIPPLGDGATDEVRPPWDDRAWDRAAWISRGALDPAGVAAGAVTALAVTREGALLIATERGARVYATKDEGKTFAAASGWITRAHTLVPGTDAEVAASDDGGVGTAVATTVDSHGTVVNLLRGDNDDLSIGRGASVPMPLSADVALAPSMAISLAARGEALALGQHGAGAYLTTDGATWARIDGTASTTALAFVDDAGTLLVALYSPAEERAWLVRVRGDGAASIIAELGVDEADDHDVRVHALAWDEPRRMVWVAGAFGVAGFRSV